MPPAGAPSLSVVLPVYNRAAYVAEAIESVHAQTLAATEVVVVDDGSTDASVAVVERCARPAPAMLVLRQANRGIGGARNRGIAAATGDVIAFIDSDDLWEPDKLERQCEVLRSDDRVDLVFGHVVEFISPERVADLGTSLRVSDGPVPGQIATTLVARRAAVDRIGPFDETLRVGEFLEWMGRARDLGLVVHMLDRTVARRRVHGGNTVLTRSNADYLRALKMTLDRRRAATERAG